MAIDTASLMGLAMLGSMKKAERARAETPLVLTLVPGPPTTRAAIAAVAVGDQARDGLRREGRVAAAVLTAAEAVAAGQEPSAAFAAQPALRDLSPEVLATRFEAIPGGRPRPQLEDLPEEKRLVEALKVATEMLIAAIGRSKNQLFTEDEAAKYDDYLDMLSADTRAKIVKASGHDPAIDV